VSVPDTDGAAKTEEATAAADDQREKGLSAWGGGGRESGQDDATL
jgi:hypothetical protein